MVTAFATVERTANEHVVGMVIASGQVRGERVVFFLERLRPPFLSFLTAPFCLANHA